MWFILQFFKSVLVPLIGNAHARYDENKSPKKTEMNIKIRWTASKADVATKKTHSGREPQFHGRLDDFEQ